MRVATARSAAERLSALQAELRRPQDAGRQRGPAVAAVACETASGPRDGRSGAAPRAATSSVAAACSNVHGRCRRPTAELANGLRLHRVGVPGTGAITVLVAFDAGARTERPEENGMAHFLEHLVFKGGDKYPNHRAINETAEALGGVLNAYTSHDLVAFHITARAEAAPEAIDLLTDFVARPRIDADELDKERGVVIQEINRAYDQPSMVAEYLIDRAAFGDHPLGRPVLGSEENLRAFTREGIVAFRERRWSGRHGGAYLVGNLDHLPDDARLAEAFGRFPALPEPDPYLPVREFDPTTLVEERDTNQSHLRMIYRPDVETDDERARAALTIYATLLGGSMSSRLFEEIREQRGLCYSVYAVDHAFADVPILQLGSGLDSVASAPRPTGACARSSTSCAPRDRRATRSIAPAPTPPAAACSRSRTPAPSRARPRPRRSSTARTPIPARASRRSTRHVRRGRRGRPLDRGPARGRRRRSALGRRVLGGRRSPPGGAPARVRDGASLFGIERASRDHRFDVGPAP